MKNQKGLPSFPARLSTFLSTKQAGKARKNPFTFTSLTTDPNLQFTIKIYPDSEEGVTRHLSELTVGDVLIISDAWGAIEYKGPGYFIAGGAGITPFIAIFRDLYKKDKLDGNVLFFSNNTTEDIIIADELKIMLGDKAIFTTTKEKGEGEHRKINEAFLKDEVDDFKKHFYVCGPDAMVKEISETLEKLGAKMQSVVFEK